MRMSMMIASILILTFGLCGCSSNTPEAAGAAAPWKSGTYVGKGDEWEYGSEDATVVISSGRITSITLRKFNNKSQEVNYEEWTGQAVKGQMLPNLKQYKVDLAKAMLSKQSAAVDDISGATISCRNWRTAVDRVLKQAAQR